MMKIQMMNKLGFNGGINVIDFTEKVKKTKEADETLNKILNKNYDTFEQYEEVSKITDIEVAKVIIKRLLDKIS